jgi:hypothetical protein
LPGKDGADNWVPRLVVALGRLWADSVIVLAFQDFGHAVGTEEEIEAGTGPSPASPRRNALCGTRSIALRIACSPSSRSLARQALRR